jgi:HlyD family secretion protein
MLVDVQVSEVDINSIQVNQPVELTFDAVQDKEYSGKVTKIGQIGVSTSGAINFVVTVEINGVEDAIKPGMTAAVNIAVNQLQNAILIPNRAVRTVNNNRVVYLLKNGIPMPVQVTLGVSDGTYSALDQGDVKVGDSVVLNPPSSGFGFGGMQQSGGGQ